jgi:hypothetical protein
MTRDPIVKDRFEAKYIPIPEAGCWIWTGAAGRYGAVTINRKHIDAHRLSWLLYRGPIPDGLRVLHRCDVCLCVNPSHLFLGTAKDNSQDMVMKGRHRKPRINNAPSGDNHWKRRRGLHAFP